MNRGCIYIDIYHLKPVKLLHLFIIYLKHIFYKKFLSSKPKIFSDKTDIILHFFSNLFDVCLSE